MTRTLPWLAWALALLPAIASVPAAAWENEDGANDQELVVEDGRQPLPSHTATRHMDLRKVSFAREDELGFLVTLRVEALVVDPGRPLFTSSCFSQGWGFGLGSSMETFRVAFSVPQLRATYEVDVQLYGRWQQDGTFIAHAGAGCMKLGAAFDRCPLQGINVDLDGEADAVRIEVPKVSLLGKNGVNSHAAPCPETPAASALMGPAHVEDIVVTSLSRFTSLYGFQISEGPKLVDRVPDAGAGGPFPLAKGLANVGVFVRIEQGEPELAVVPGENQTVSFRIGNPMPAARLLLVEYQFSRADGGASPYVAHGPHTIRLPGGANRTFRLVLDASKVPPEGPAGLLDVRVTSLGQPGEVGLARAVLRPSLPLKPTQGTLYLQAHVYEGQGCLLPYSMCYAAFLSALEHDGRGNSPVYPYRIWPYSGAGIEGRELFDAAARSPVALWLDSSKRLPMEWAFRTTVAVPDVNVSATVTATNGTSLPIPVAAASTLVDLEPGTTTVRMDPSLSKPMRLPRGTMLRVLLEVSAPYSPGAVVEPHGYSIDLLPVQSRLTLPLLAPQDDLEAQQAAGPFQLSLLSSSEDYVNPGEARLFEFSLLNQDVQNHEAWLDVASALDGWRVEVLPGTHYNVAPGDLLRVGVRVGAPNHTIEGTRAAFTVTARASSGAAASARFSALVVSGVELEDDGQKLYDLDDASVQRLAGPPPARTPLPGAMVFGGALGAALRLARRP